MSQHMRLYHHRTIDRIYSCDVKIAKHYNRICTPNTIKVIKEYIRKSFACVGISYPNPCNCQRVIFFLFACECVCVFARRKPLNNAHRDDLSLAYILSVSVDSVSTRQHFVFVLFRIYRFIL